MDQRFTILIVVLYRKRVTCHAAVRSVAPPNLLAARQGGLPGRMLAARQSGIVLQLVSAVERRRVRGGRQARADAESIDRCIGLGHYHELTLVETAAREDGHFGQA